MAVLRIPFILFCFLHVVYAGAADLQLPACAVSSISMPSSGAPHEQD